MCGWVLVIVDPPIVVGAWSMAFLLGQHVECHYYCVVRQGRIQEGGWGGCNPLFRKELATSCSYTQ